RLTRIQEVPAGRNSPASLSTRQWLTARRKAAQARPDGSVRAAGSVATVPVTVIGMADIGGSSAVWLRASGADALAFSQHRDPWRSEEHTSELQSRFDLVCRLLLEKKKNNLTHFLM